MKGRYLNFGPTDINDKGGELTSDSLLNLNQKPLQISDPSDVPVQCYILFIYWEERLVKNV